MAQKFCHRCGVQLAENAKVCHKCGTSVQGATPKMPTASQSAYLSQSTYATPIKNLFLENDEQQVAVLTRGIIGTWIAKGVLGRNFVVLSDRRLYESGVSTKTLSFNQYLQVLPLEAISSMGYYSQISLWPIIMGVTASLGIVIEIGDEVGNWIGFLIGFIGAVFWTVIFFLTRNKLFKISSDSGEVSLNFKVYGEERIQEFARKVGETYSQRIKTILEKGKVRAEELTT